MFSAPWGHGHECLPGPSIKTVVAQCVPKSTVAVSLTITTDYAGFINAHSLSNTLKLISWPRHSECAQGEKERLVTLDRSSWTLLECWWHQSDCWAFNNFIYLLYWSHDQYFQTRTRTDSPGTRPWQWFTSYTSLTVIHELHVLDSRKQMAQTTHDYFLLITNITEQLYVSCLWPLPRCHTSMPRKPVYSDQTFFLRKHLAHETTLRPAYIKVAGATLL